MSFESGIDRAVLTVLLDPRHPFSYLALGPAIAFGRERGIGINWLPLEVPPLKAPSAPGEGDDRGILHRRSRARAIAREIETYAAVQGLTMVELYRAGEWAALRLGWLWLRDRAPDRLEEFLEEAFRAYWSAELDPASHEAVAALVSEMDCGADDFDAWARTDGSDAASALARELAGRGLSGVPGYLVGGELFLGRQHLPMIRWILDGRVGSGPI